MGHTFFTRSEFRDDDNWSVLLLLGVVLLALGACSHNQNDPADLVSPLHAATGTDAVFKHADSDWLVVHDQSINGAQVNDLHSIAALRKLTIYNCTIDDSVLRSIATLHKLTYLNLGHTRPVNDRSLQGISRLHRLTLLSLGQTAVTNDGLSALAELTDLRWLDLYGTRVSDEGLLHLTHLDKLERLTLHFASVRGPGLRHLYGLVRLRELTLDSSVRSEDVTALQQQLRELRIEIIPVMCEFSPAPHGVPASTQ